MAVEQAYELAKDIIYNLGERPQPVRVLVIAPPTMVHAIERHFRSLLRPDLHLVEDNGIRFAFRDGGRVAILERLVEQPTLWAEGNRVY